METWSAHQLYREAEPRLGPEPASRLQKYAQALMDAGLPVVFSLGHLSRMTHVSYRTLRDTVDRRRESANYRMFAVGKRSGGLRFIHAVSGELLSAQRFINKEILQKVTPHPAAFAFHPSGGIRACAATHCSAQWLFHFDLSDFFYHVTEADAYRVFAARLPQPSGIRDGPDMHDDAPAQAPHKAALETPTFALRGTASIRPHSWACWRVASRCPYKPHAQQSGGD